jgi:hypothetical protein
MNRADWRPFAGGDDGQVRLRLGHIGSPEWSLDANFGAIAEGTDQELVEPSDAEDVRLSLRAHSNQPAVE